MDLKFAASLLLFCEILSTVYGQVQLSLTRRPAQSLPLRLRCIADREIRTMVRFYMGSTIQGYCTAEGQCVSRNRGASLQKSSREVTFTIRSLTTDEEGVWSCRLFTDPLTFSNEVTIEKLPVAVDWGQVTFSPEWTSRRSVTPDESVILRVNVPCTNKAPSFTWTYQMRARGKFQTFPYYYSSTHERESGCPSGQKKYESTCTILGKTPKFYNRRVKVRVDVEHDSFDPPRYMKFKESRSVQFPVPIKSVAMTSDRDETHQVVYDGESLFFSCVTSRSFPPGRIHWFSMREGDNQPTELSESLSTSSQPYPDTAVTSTSNLTMAAGRELHERVIFCQASNFDDKPAVRSKEVEFTVFYPPSKPEITIPSLCAGSEVTLTCTSKDLGNPATNYSWTRNGEEIVDGLSEDGSMWTFTPSAADNGTTILCYLSNNITDKGGNSQIESDVSYLDVMVNDLPVLTIEGDLDINEGDNVTLTCTSDLPEVEISWIHPGGSVEGPTLMLYNVALNETGIYECIGTVQTACGISQQSVEAVDINFGGVSRSSSSSSTQVLVFVGALIAFILHL